ncbi:MAG: hypothetical protein M3Y07_16395 [Acidobacteriota bacterium]|nr:hypothetical protein [Acidobacteriota bacterium]
MSNRCDGGTVLDAPATERWQPMSKVVELRFGVTPVIENRWGYPSEAVERLRDALRRGASARPDPVRCGIYEVEAGGSVYYIHVSPISQRVMLLAVWGAR